MFFSSNSDDRPGRTDLFWSVERAERLRLLAELAQPSTGAVVVCRSDDEATRVADALSRQGVPAAAPGHRDFESTRIRVKVVPDGANPPGAASALVVHFDPAPGPRQHRRRGDLYAASHGAVVTFVVPERRDDAIDLMRRLDAPVSLTDPDPRRVFAAATATEAGETAAGRATRARATAANLSAKALQTAAQAAKRGAAAARAWRQSRRQPPEPLP